MRTKIKKQRNGIERKIFDEPGEIPCAVADPVFVTAAQENANISNEIANNIGSFIYNINIFHRLFNEIYIFL